MRIPAQAMVLLLLVGSVAVSGCSIRADPPHQFLSAATYASLLIEIDHQQGKGPHSSAVDLLKTRIEERCHKPGGINVLTDSFTESDTVWTLEEIIALEKAKRDRHASGSTAVLYILYLGGRYEKGNVIGIKYSPTSFVLFKDSIANAANPTNPLFPLGFTAIDVERSVIVHEFGHILGLVNLGTPMVEDHEDPDPEHRGHSKNKDSVMYYAVESLFISQVFTGPPPTDFDAQDKADLRAAGGK